MELPVDITHPAWLTGFSTLFSYILILTVLAVTVFAVPYLIFLIL